MSYAAALTAPLLFAPRKRVRTVELCPPRAAHAITQVKFTYSSGLHAILYRPVRSHRAGTLPVCVLLAGGGYINSPIMTPNNPPSLSNPEINAAYTAQPYVVDICRADMAAIALQYSATNINGGTVASAATAMIGDLSSLWTWLEANKAAYGLSTTKVGVGGVSAGGQGGARFAYGDHAFAKPTNIGGVFMAAANFILKSNGVAQVTGDVTKVVTGDPPACFVHAENDERYEEADSVTMRNRFTAQSVAYTQYTLAGASHGDVGANVVLSSGNTISREIAAFMRPKLM